VQPKPGGPRVIVAVDLTILACACAVRGAAQLSTTHSPDLLRAVVGKTTNQPNHCPMLRALNQTVVLESGEIVSFLCVASRKFPTALLEVARASALVRSCLIWHSRPHLSSTHSHKNPSQFPPFYTSRCGTTRPVSPPRTAARVRVRRHVRVCTCPGTRSTDLNTRGRSLICPFCSPAYIPAGSLNLNRRSIRTRQLAPVSVVWERAECS
jgi:hypothetical protein